MNTYVQLTDITEIGQLTTPLYPGQRVRTAASPESLAEAFRGTEKTIKTELAFFHFGQYARNRQYAEVLEEAEKLGFKEVSMTLNWHSAHFGDHPICLWMKQYPDNSPQVPKRHCYMAEGFAINGFNNVFGFGCGGRIVEDFDGLMMADPRGLTILRLPKKTRLTGPQKLWLQMRNYRLVFLTSTGQVWVNGWTPEEYVEEKEREFWKAFEKNQRNVADDDFYDEDEEYEAPEDPGDDE
jgi:hypothetical protein